MIDALTATGLVLIGLLLLAGGGEALVRAATTLAELAGVTPAVIGLTVVALGTSLPELVVSLMAAARGEPDLAVANVVGSNIFNVAATLGLTALMIPLPVHGTAVRLEWPVMFGSSLLCLLVARSGEIDRLEGGFFVISLGLFIAYTVRVAGRDVGVAEARQFAEQAEARDIDVKTGRKSTSHLLITFGVLALGVLGLVAGGKFLVDGAIALARLAGKRWMIGTTLLLLPLLRSGSRLPE